MSGILGSITGALGRLFRNFWGDPSPPELPESSKSPKLEEGSEAKAEGESEYETADEGSEEDTTDSEDETKSDNESEPEESKIIFRRIEDPAPKRIIESKRISDHA
jgi:hypothetical protein